MMATNKDGGSQSNRLLNKWAILPVVVILAALTYRSDRLLLRSVYIFPSLATTTRQQVKVPTVTKTQERADFIAALDEAFDEPDDLKQKEQGFHHLPIAQTPSSSPTDESSNTVTSRDYNGQSQSTTTADKPPNSEKNPDPSLGRASGSTKDEATSTTKDELVKPTLQKEERAKATSPPHRSNPQGKGRVEEGRVEEDLAIAASIRLHEKETKGKKYLHPLEQEVIFGNASAVETDDGDVSSSDTTPPHIATALCHKTIFGKIDLHSLAQWAAYHRLLGFDHVFIWYLPELQNSSDFHRWNQLATLPYVTLLPNTVGRVKVYHGKYQDGYVRLEKGKPGDQADAEKWCLNHTASLHYRMVMIADGDEFLWFQKRQSLQDFLQPFRDHQYLSFGKWMYSTLYGTANDITTRSNTADMAQDYFGLNRYPFTAHSFCVNKKLGIGNDKCPQWPGRSKVMVNPKRYKKVQVHGSLGKFRSQRGEHLFSTRDAHMKEWAGLYATSEGPSIVQAPVTFALPLNVTKAGIHNFNSAHPEHPPGARTLYYDDELRDWFAFVVGRGV